MAEKIARDALEARVARWVAQGAAGFRARRERALCVGVCAPQGAGKSTLCARLCEQLSKMGLRAETLSIDDVYLTRAEQRALAERHPNHRYLEVRGYPGTHDVRLGEQTLDTLMRARAGASIAVVGYDKGAHEGLGDRAEPARWRRVEGPFDVLFFEGWMLGFCPVEDRASIDDPQLRRCDELVERYAGWRARVDRWVLFEAAQVEFVIDWRVESERVRREREGRGLSDEGARAYVERFLPAYRLWWSGARVGRGLRGPALRAVLDADRTCSSLEEVTLT
jgi:D-glycerate 3-kinase